MTNPLTDTWQTPFEVPPFDRIHDEDFAPAFEKGFAEARAAIAKIADQTEAPTFQNTIAAMEQAEDLLRDEIMTHLDALPNGEQIMLKLLKYFTIPK